jgi:hypothetical protein
MPAATPKFSRKSAVTTPKAPSRGTFVRVMTSAERIADMQEHGQKESRTKASALAFLQRAGIVDASGDLAEPFRT